MQKILAWEKHQGNVEIPFRPGRVILQDFTGVPAVVDFAAMRDAGNMIYLDFLASGSSSSHLSVCTFSPLAY